MGFYNPTMKGPDWGSGISGITQQMQMMELLEKMFGGGGDPNPMRPMDPTTQGGAGSPPDSTTPLPGRGGLSRMGTPPPNLAMGGQPGMSGGPRPDLSMGGNPEMQKLMMLMKMLMQGGRGGMPGGGAMPGMGV